MDRKSKFEDVSWFLDQHQRGQLELDPSYQRRSVWTDKDREFYMDTIFKNYPCPAVFLHQVIDDNGRAVYNVVDGKQRLETIIKFAQDKVRIPFDFGDTNLNGKRFSDLTTEQKKRFWGYSIAVEQLPDIEQAIVNSVFDRINRNARKLTRQELRHAKFDGWVAQFTEKESSDEDWSALGVVTKARAKRMNDVQFLSELLLAVVRNGLTGFSQETLDEFYAEYDDPEDKPDFSQEAVETKFFKVKSYLRQMFESSPTIKKSWSSLANIYSIWVYVVVKEDLPAPQVLAEKYLQFMHDVTLAASATSNNLLFGDQAGKYAANSVGATTDRMPRLARHEVLMDVL